MVWGGISVQSRTPLVVMVGRQQTSDYSKIMEDVLVPFAEENMPIKWTYQQDNAPIHVSKDAHEWFKEQYFALMEWLSRSPDLNPIKNLWYWLARKVYGRNQQYDTVKDLHEALEDCWNNVPNNLIVTLINSMQERCTQFLERGGCKSSYQKLRKTYFLL